MVTHALSPLAVARKRSASATSSPSPLFLGSDGDEHSPSGAILKPNVKLMSNSERGKYYRHKRKMYAAELQQNVARLQQQVEILLAEQQLQNELRVSACHTSIGSFARVVQAYLTHFEYGTPVVRRRDSDAIMRRVAIATPEQVALLSSVMEQDVAFGEVRGIPLLVDQWEKYTMFHDAFHFEVTSLEVISGEVKAGTGENDDGDAVAPLPIITIRANTHVRLSRMTIENVFPHLLGDEALLQKLIGLDVTYPSLNTFYFNPSGKIERYDVEVDFMGTFLRTVESVESTTHVLSHARIVKDHMIGVRKDELDDLQREKKTLQSHYSIRSPPPEPPRIVEVLEEEKERPVATEDDECEQEPESKDAARKRPPRKLDLEYILA
uniref:BZIP domain-containing protein n=1 Tax=Globisporangium ultimum (strain ATCC 200006 / CBS 805.95 / DAOM BR144) TaxID=431595 RepID=K3WNP3_GLOUD